MKTKFYLIVILLFSFISFTFSANDMSFDDGNENGGGKPRSNSFNFSAEIEDGDYINFSFPSNIGIVEISIENEQGVVVSKRLVDTASMNNLLIDIFNFSDGIYTLRVITRQTSESVYTKFSI